jgi:hypothetical protein
MLEISDPRLYGAMDSYCRRLWMEGGPDPASNIPPEKRTTTKWFNAPEAAGSEIRLGLPQDFLEAQKAHCANTAEEDVGSSADRESEYPADTDIPGYAVESKAYERAIRAIAPAYDRIYTSTAYFFFRVDSGCVETDAQLAGRDCQSACLAGRIESHPLTGTNVLVGRTLRGEDCSIPSVPRKPFPFIIATRATPAFPKRMTYVDWSAALTGPLLKFAPFRRL